MALQSDHFISSRFLASNNASPRFAWEKLRELSMLSISDFAPSTWVKLFSPPTAFAYDEAWLLCQFSEDQWLAWIPDYGEILLKTRDFCSLSDR
jgi:hypothetical protein